MSADDSADPGRQRTVAELLAQHGGGSTGGSRRRRRAAEDDDEPASPAGGTGASRAEATESGATRSGATRSGATSSARRSRDSSSGRTPTTPQVPEQRWAGAAGLGQSIDPLTGEPIDTPPGQTFGAVPRGAGATGSYRSIPLARVDPPTEELPLYPETGWASRAKDGGPMTGPIAGPSAGGRGAAALDRTVAGPTTGQVSRAELFDEPDEDRDDEHDRDHDDADDDAGERWGRRASAAPAGLAERGEHGELVDDHHDEDYDDDDEVDGRPEGVAGWLALIVQWVVGAVAGALLWVGFSYLWMHVPVVALVAAVAATAVLVLVVRAIRRSDDLQTTMLAVLVGLVVTISPAVLLLAAR
jgi:uncharacterized membrane protein YeaQ/YmgE (transglycosylase-associated protein family)